MSKKRHLHLMLLTIVALITTSCSGEKGGIYEGHDIIGSWQSVVANPLTQTTQTYIATFNSNANCETTYTEQKNGQTISSESNNGRYSLNGSSLKIQYNNASQTTLDNYTFSITGNQMKLVDENNEYLIYTRK